MSSHKNRIAQLEKQSGAHDVYKYMCVIPGEWMSSWDSSDERAKGYKIQPLINSAGGNGGEPFYIATEAELNEFAARPDVDLQIIVISYESAADAINQPTKE